MNLNKKSELLNPECIKSKIKTHFFFRFYPTSSAGAA